MQDNDSRFYVYEHLKADTGEVFYIGKGSGNRAVGKTARSQRWKDIERKHGRIVRYVATGLGEQEAFDIEREMIKQAQDRGCDLCNVYVGGKGGTSGWKHSDEHIQWLKSNNPMSRPEVRAKISGDNSWMHRNGHRFKGRVMDDQTKRKISQSNSGKVRSQEVRDRLRQRQLSMSDEQRERIAESVRSLPKLECPHCCKIGSPGNMKRWHFDNCKHKAEHNGTE